MKTTTLVMLMVLSSVTYAAGGGSMPTMSQPHVQKTPVQRAVDSYNAGIKNRNKAWKYQDRAALETNPKKSAKLERKAIKQFKNAIKKFRASIKNEPRLYQAHGGLGYALKQTGDYAGAMAAYSLCLSLQPDYTPAIEYRAEAHLALGETDKTKEAYVQLARVDPRLAIDLENAIREWIENPPTDTDHDSIEDLRNWIAEVTKPG